MDSVGTLTLPGFIRLASKIRNAGPDECWEWLGWRTAAGYATFRVGRRRIPAHRVVYELLVGPIPPGLTIDHLCRNPGCVNPRHLEPVTMKENIRRGVPYRRSAARDFTCEWCSISFSRRPSQERKRTRRFCSAACYWSYRRATGGQLKKGMSA